MKKETEKILKRLSEDYNIINVSVTEDSTVDYLKIGESIYHVYKGMSDNEIDDTVSYITCNESLTDVSNVVPVEESLDDIEVGKLYKYEPKGLDDFTLEDFEDFANETELFKIAKYSPLCKVKDKLIVSKEEDGFILVTFDIPENADKIADVDVRGKDYIVFDSDLVPANIEVKEDIDVNTIEKVNNNNDTSTNLLTALNSEKEAVIIYEMLLKMTDDEEEIELLTKILNDEKEHVALLSGLQTKQVADFVAEDNKEILDTNAQDVIDTPAATE